MNTKVIDEIDGLRSRIPALAIKYYGDNAVWKDLFIKEKEYILTRTAIIIGEWLDPMRELSKLNRDIWYSYLTDILKSYCSEGLISFAIQQMSYKEFLTTPTPQTIRSYKKNPKIIIPPSKLSSEYSKEVLDSMNEFLQ